MEYKIERLLYEGNDGPVYLVRNKEDNHLWVAKNYNYDSQDRDGLDPSLLVEILCLQQFKKEKHLLNLHSVSMKKESVELILEAMDGEITELILENSSPAKIKNYLQQILSGLIILHEHGMIHNDIKPKNILYKKHNNGITIKIIDFGLVYLINFPYYRAGRIQTTHHYTPPEYRDHRNVGRVSVNSDMFSLGVIFYYFLNPQHYRKMDKDPYYDYIFDPSVINWKIVKERGGVKAEDLLRKMMQPDPQKRISSLTALKHPYFGKTKTKTKQTGGSRGKRWELPRILTKDEYQNPRNELQFLPAIIERNIRTVDKIRPKQRVPPHIWNLLYGYFLKHGLKFVTLNYAICLLQQYLEKKKVRDINWEEIAVACLYISIKLNQYRGVGLSHFDENPKQVLKFELDVVKTLDWEFQVPVLLTKEAILFHKYFKLIYEDKAPGDSIIKTSERGLGRYHQFYLIHLLSSLFYLSPDLANVSKMEQINVVLSFFFKVKHSAELRKKVEKLLKSRKIFWMEKSLLEYLNL
jgi:serine/threonine protein kinase